MSQETGQNERTFPELRSAGGALWRGVKWIWRKTWRVGLGLLILLIIAHIVTNIVAGRMLEAELRKIRESGAPLTLTEAAPPEIPAEENAARLYMPAFETIRDNAAMETVVKYLLPTERRGAEPPPALEEVESALASLSGEIEAIEQASKMEKCRFPVEWEAGAGALFPHFAMMRQATRLFLVKAHVEAERGQVEAAMNSLAVIIRMTNHGAKEPTLISQLVQAACVAMTADTFEEIAHEAKPTLEESRELRSALWAIDPVATFRQAIEGERALGLWAFDHVREDGPQAVAILSNRDVEGWLSKAWPVLRFVYEPVLKLDEVQFLRYTAQTIEWYSKPRIANQEEAPFARGTDGEKNIPKYAIVTHMTLPAYSRVFEKRDSEIALIRILRTALYLSDYYARDGDYPASLAELENIPLEVMVDPFNGKPLIYRTEDNGAYVLYSVGPNLVDDGGRTYKEAARAHEHENHDVILEVGGEPDTAD